MNIKEIEAVVTVSQSKSFYEAAFMLNYSPSVISKYISNVERALDVKLFVRGNRSAAVSLTEEGAALMPHFARIHNNSVMLKSATDALKSAAKSFLKIGTGYNVSSLGMDEILADFFSAYPEIRIEQTKLDFESQIHGLYSGRQDGIFVLVLDGSPDSAALERVVKDPKIESFLLVRERDMYLGVSEKFFPDEVTGAPFSMFEDFHIAFHSDQAILKNAGTMRPFIELSESAGFKLNPIYIDPRDTSAYYLATKRKIAIPSLRGSFNYPGFKFVRIENWNSSSSSYFLSLRKNRRPELQKIRKCIGVFIGD